MTPATLILGLLATLGATESPASVAPIDVFVPEVVAPVPVEVSRSEPVPVDDLDVRVVSPSVVNLPLFRGPTAVEVHLQVLEKAGVETLLHAPVVVGLTRLKGGEGAGASYTSATLCTGALETTLQPFDTRDLPVCVTDVAEPGSYNGQIRVTTARGEDVSQPVAFSVRDSWLLCALAITAGALISFLVHQWTSSRRERVLVEARVRRAISGIERRFPRLDDPIRQALVQSLEDTWQQVRIGESVNAIQAIDEAERRARQWIPVQELLDLRGELDTFVLDPEDRKDVERELDDLARQASRRDLAQLDAVAGAPSPLAAAADRVRRRMYARSLKGVQSALKTLLGSLPVDAGPVRGRLEHAIREVEEDLAQNGDPVLLDLRDAVATYGGLVDEVDSAQASRARRWIESRNVPVPGFTPAEWDETRSRLLKDLAQGHLEPTDLVGSLLPRMSVALTDPAVQARLRECATLPPWGAFDVLVGVLDRVRGAMAAEVASAAPPPPKAAVAPMATPPSPGPVRERIFHKRRLRKPNPADPVRPLASILRQLKRNDLLVWAVTLAVSALAGIELLWLQRADWGGLSDFIYAFLWGFGLDLVGKGALDRLSSVLPHDTIGSGSAGQVL